jgi:hypothetical protein
MKKISLKRWHDALTINMALGYIDSPPFSDVL